MLDGNLTQECGLCSKAARCNPLADDWEAFKNPTTGNDLKCLPDCDTHPCEGLTGNPHFECGGCTGKGDSSCHPGAPHFDDWFERRKQEL